MTIAREWTNAFEHRNADTGRFEPTVVVLYGLYE